MKRFQMKTCKNLLRALLFVCLAVALPLGSIAAAPQPHSLPSPPPAAAGDHLPIIIQLASEPAALYQARAFGGKGLDVAAATLVREHTARLRAEQDAFLKAARDQGLELAVRRRYTYVFNGLAAAVKLTDLAALAALPGVKAIHPDTEVHACLPDSVPLIGAPTVWAMGATGAGIRVAIVDTGIDYTHPDLGGGTTFPTARVIAGYDFVNDDADPMDDHGHGTHCAGIVAANGVLKGVAPDALLMGYKVLSAGGSGSFSDIIAGVERACDPDGDPATDDGAHVISMSLGGPGDPGDPTSQAVDAASALGVVVVVAAGNSGPGYQTIGSPGVAHSAVTVGATDKSDVIAYFSSRGPVQNSWAIKPDLCAPGVKITSTVPLTGSIGSPTRYQAISGTSMATPHVAGVAALLRQLHPTWSPATVKAAMMETALDLGLDPYVQGSGRVRADQAALSYAVILPASLSLGADDLTQPQWSQSEVLALTNLTTETMTYTLSYTGALPAGINILLNPTQLTVGPGETRNFSFLLTVDNETVPNVTEAPYAYTGQVLAQPHAKALALRVPFAFIKSPILKVHLEGDLAFTLLVHDRADWRSTVSIPAETTSFAVSPGQYDVLASFLPTADRPGWHFVAREKVWVGTMTEVTLRDSVATHRLELVTEDEQGQPITPTNSIGLLTYPPTGASLSPYKPFGTIWYLSDVSADYHFDAAAFRKAPDAGALYSFFGQSVGVSGDVEFQPDASAFRRVSHPVHLPTAQGTIALNEMRTPLTSLYDIFLQMGVMTTTLPYVRQAHYMAAPGTQFSTGYLQRTIMTPQREVLLACAPLRRSADGLLEGYTQDGSYSLFATDADVIPLGLNPPHWFGRLTSTATEIQLRSAVGGGYNLFATQWSDVLPTAGLPYTLRRDGTVVGEGQFPKPWIAPTIPVTLTGHYSLTVPFTYTLGISPVVEGHASAIADFDTRLADKDPPAIVNLWLQAGGTPTDEPYGSPKVLVTLTDTVGVVSATLAYNAGAGWTDIPLTRMGRDRLGDDYSWHVPAQTPDTHVALRLRAWDAAGNTLTYELWPAYVQAPYRYWLPLVLKDGTP